MSTPPPPQLLNKEFLRRCRDIVLSDGWIKEIAKELGVEYKTVFGWYSRDAQNFGEKMARWRTQQMIEKANKIIEDTLAMDVSSPVLFFGKEIGTQINPRLVKIKVDNAQFVLEMLSKDYRKRRELSGPSGTPLRVQIINYGDPRPIEDMVQEEDL